MPFEETPIVDYATSTTTPEITSLPASASPSETSSSECNSTRTPRPTALFRALTATPPDPPQLTGQDELERRIPGYKRIVIPREPTLIELLRQSSGVETNDEVLSLRTVRLRVIAEKVGLRRLNTLVPLLKTLVLDGSAISTLRTLGTGLTHLTELHVARCGLTTLDGILGVPKIKILNASSNRISEVFPLASLHHLTTLNLAENLIAYGSQMWPLSVRNKLRDLTLVGCPASKQANYKESLCAILPSLEKLDGCDMAKVTTGSGDHVSATVDILKIEADEKNTTLDADPSNDDAAVAHSSKDSGTLHTATPKQRPASALPLGSGPKIILDARPHTTGCTIAENSFSFSNHTASSPLTSGSPMFGNIAHALKRQRKKEFTFQEALASVTRILNEQPMSTSIMDAWKGFPKPSSSTEEVISTTENSFSANSALVMDRLEEIERETSERLRGISREPHVLDNPAVLNNLLTRMSAAEPINYPEATHLLSNDDDSLFDDDDGATWRRVDEALKPFSKDLKLAMLSNKQYESGDKG